MSTRGTYGVVVGAGRRGSSLGKWIVGGVLVGGAALWARHQSEQISQLYKAVGLPHRSFVEGLREDARKLPSATRAKFHATREKLHELTHVKKEVL
jgi:hypothetical protein